MTPEQPDDVRKNVGRRIAELRHAQGRTQESVAEQLGMQMKNYQRIERGLQNVTIKTLVRIANALGVSTAELFSPAAPREVRRGRPPKRRGPSSGGEGGA